MGNRKKYEFSIISYNQNSLRDESINIGAFMFNKEDPEAMYKIIPDNSQKIKGLAINKSQKELFKSTMNYLDFSLKKLRNEFSTILMNETLEKDIPEHIRFSKPKPIITSNEELIFKQLIEEYVGNEYFNLTSKIEMLSPKEKMLNLFNSHNLLNSKVKKNVKIQPSKKVSARLQVDFAFGKNNQLNLIDSAPTNNRSLDEWYYKMVTFSSKYDPKSEILLLSDSTNPINNDKKVTQMISDLQSDSRIKSVDLSETKDIYSLIDDISNNSVDTRALETLIANNHIA